jgi:hypothetical protein
MNFVEELLVFNKTDRLHRMIISYLPAHEREENYLPISERSAFSMRKEYDLVIEQLKTKSRAIRRGLYTFRLMNDIYQGYCDLRGVHFYTGFSSIEDSIDLLTYSNKRRTSGCGVFRIINDLREYPPGRRGRKPNSYYENLKNAKTFLEKNGFVLTGREDARTLARLLMSF